MDIFDSDVWTSGSGIWALGIVLPYVLNMQCTWCILDVRDGDRAGEIAIAIND